MASLFLGLFNDQLHSLHGDEWRGDFE